MMPRLSFWPKVIAVFIFATGVLNVLSTLLQRPMFWIIFAAEITSWDVLNYSRIITVVSGLMLIILAQGIWQRKHRAWSLSVGLVTISLGTHILKRSPLIEFVILLIVLSMLLYFRHEFRVRSDHLRLRNRLATASLAVLLVTLYSLCGYYLLRREYSPRVTPIRLFEDYWNTVTGTGKDVLHPRSRRAILFENSLTDINSLTLLLIFAGLFAPLIQTAANDEKKKTQLELAQAENGESSVSYFALQKDKTVYWHNSMAVAYGVQNRTAVVIGEPLAPVSSYGCIINQFVQAMRECGLSTVFYLATQANYLEFTRAGLQVLKIGEEAIIHPVDFDLTTPEHKRLRNSLAHVQKEGVQFACYTADKIPPEILAEYELLHAAWLKQTPLPRLKFSLDFHPLPADPHVILSVALSPTHKVLSALTFLPYKQHTALALDAMLRAAEIPNGTVEALIAYSIQESGKHSIAEVSLGLVALAQTKPDRITPKLVQKGQAFLFRYFHQFYNYQSLFHFKDKFHPQWEPRYLAYTNRTELMKVAIAVVGIHTRRLARSSSS